MSDYTSIKQVHDDLASMLEFTWGNYHDLALILDNAFHVSFHLCGDEDEEAES